MTQGPDHEVTDTGTTFPSERKYVDFKGKKLPADSFKIYREGDIDWWAHDDGQYLVCSDVSDDWWEMRESGQSENVPDSVPMYAWVYADDDIDEDVWGEYIVEPDDEPVSWNDVETTSPTPLADELRDFADEVERLERTVDDDAQVDPYYTGEKMRVSVVYPTDGVYPE